MTTPAFPRIHPPSVPLYEASPGQAILLFFTRYARFKGLSSQSEYWWSLVFQLTVIVLLAVIQVVTDFSPASRSLSTVVRLIIFVPGVAVTWRRLHDAGFPGFWWFLHLIPVLGSVVVLIMCAVPTWPSRQKPHWDDPQRVHK